MARGNLRRDDVPAEGWEIRQDIIVNEWTQANVIALDALSRGATALGFIIPDNLKVGTDALRNLLKDVYIDCISLNFDSTLQADAVILALLEICREDETDPKKLKGSVNVDPLGYLTIHGDYPGGTEKAFESLANLLKEASVELPGIQIVGIGGHHFSNAGSSIIEELAFSLAMVSEYLDKLSGRALPVDTISRAMRLNFASGPSYFMEIAKIRAARLLYAELLKAWKPDKTASEACYIHSSTASWNQTVYDPWVNMLRSTTESMAAVIGGCDSLSVLPFDHPFRKATPFSERIARNTQIVLREEAALDKVTDPASGSYYIEYLTDAIADKAWKLFLQTEEKGGYIRALEEGFIQQKDEGFGSAKGSRLCHPERDPPWHQSVS